MTDPSHPPTVTHWLAPSTTGETPGTPGPQTG
jgi:hypothetical protein